MTQPIKGDDVIAEARRMRGVSFREVCAVYENLLPNDVIQEGRRRCPGKQERCTYYEETTHGKRWMIHDV